jgi:hypothetical protein
MEAANITGSDGTLNRQAKSAARSAFESAKQRFFGHLLTSMKTPTLIRSIERDLEDGHAAVVQIVSTGEALMERRLAEIPTEEWNDVRSHRANMSWTSPIPSRAALRAFTDKEGNLSSRPVTRDGQPVESRSRRPPRRADRTARLPPPVPGALDQIVQRFGTDMVAEVTGRSRRIVRKEDRFAVENRAPSANLAETAAFMDDGKRAGVLGRRRHRPQLSCRTLGPKPAPARPLPAGAGLESRRRHSGPRPHQPDQPGAAALFRPIATNVKAEKRFLSTIARRLDTLGAITRGQRQTGGQGLFRPEDNLESPYARDACASFTACSCAARSRDARSTASSPPPA